MFHSPAFICTYTLYRAEVQYMQAQANHYRYSNRFKRQLLDKTKSLRFSLIKRPDTHCVRSDKKSVRPEFKDVYTFGRPDRQSVSPEVKNTHRIRQTDSLSDQRLEMLTESRDLADSLTDHK